MYNGHRLPPVGDIGFQQTVGPPSLLERPPDFVQNSGQFKRRRWRRASCDRALDGGRCRLVGTVTGMSCWILRSRFTSNATAGRQRPTGGTHQGKRSGSTVGYLASQKAGSLSLQDVSIALCAAGAKAALKIQRHLDATVTWKRLNARGRLVWRRRCRWPLFDICCRLSSTYCCRPLHSASLQCVSDGLGHLSRREFH